MRADTRIVWPATLCFALTLLRPVLAAPAPKGFAVLGSSIPEDAKHWVDVYKVIQTYNLQKYEPEVLKNREKLGVTVTEEDRKKGVIVFSRHYLDPVYEFSLPNNRVQKLSLFASLGEYEPTSFSIYALRDIDVTLSSTALTGPRGVLGKENVDIRVVTPSPFVYRDGYWREPKFLEKRKVVRVPALTSSQLWVTVYVPRGTKAGEYEGTITLRAGAKEQAQLPIRLEVLPINLAEPEVLYSMCFLIPGHPDLYPQNLDKYFVDMREHGLNSMMTWPDAGVSKAGERLLFDFSRFGFSRQGDNYFGHSLDCMVEGYRRAGFNRLWVCGSMDPIREVIDTRLGYKHFTPEFDRAYLSAIEQLLQHAKERGWPPFCLHLIDEPGGGGEGSWNMEFAEYYYRLVKEKFPQVKTMSNVGPWSKDDDTLGPLVDILSYNCAVPDAVEKCRKWGKEYWIINHGSWGRDPKLDRLTWGLFTLRNGAKAMSQWVYTWWWNMDLPKPGKYLHPAFVYVHTAPDGPIPTLAWEAVREGIDDVRYAHTLTQLIERAKSSEKSSVVREAEEAEAALSEIMAKVPQYRWKSLPAERDEREIYMEQTPVAVFDENRYQIARGILRLQQALATTRKRGA